MKLPVRRAHQLEPRAERQRWLIEQLWADQAVGIVGGAPKSCKSFCALDLAVSVASGAPCLGRFQPAQQGRVLLFAGEDPPELVRERLAGIARSTDRQLEQLDVFIITAPKLRLDVDDDRVRLSNTVETMKPKLLVLDPFVRLHSGDENVVAEVAPLLDFLRSLQRRFSQLLGPARPSRPKEHGRSSRRPGAARLLRAFRLDRLEPVASQKRRRTAARCRTPLRARPR